MALECEARFSEVAQKVWSEPTLHLLSVFPAPKPVGMAFPYLGP